MDSKYRLLEDNFVLSDDAKLYRVEALRDFGGVKAGAVGGYIQNERNLSHEGKAWVGGNAWVTGHGLVTDDATVDGEALVPGNAQVGGCAWVTHNAWVEGDARVDGNARVGGNAIITGEAVVEGEAGVGGNTRLDGKQRVTDGLHLTSPCGWMEGKISDADGGGDFLRIDVGVWLPDR